MEMTEQEVLEFWYQLQILDVKICRYAFQTKDKEYHICTKDKEHHLEFKDKIIHEDLINDGVCTVVKS